MTVAKSASVCSTRCLDLGILVAIIYIFFAPKLQRLAIYV